MSKALTKTANPAPSLHLIKLCVGADSIQDYVDWRKERAKRTKARPYHTTRMIPKRRDELLQGGSLYWVIKGVIQVRSPLYDIVPFTDDDGIKRCNLVLQPALIPVRPKPRRAFQGWRYLKPEDAPADIGDDLLAQSGKPGVGPSPAMAAALAELGLM